MTRNELKYYQKLKQKKYRDAEKKFIAEGVHLINECLLSSSYKNNIEHVIIRKNFDDADLLQKLDKSKLNISRLDDKDFDSLTETVNPQGVLSIIKKIPAGPHTKFSNEKFMVALDRINDPGNLGTIIRTCYCFGVDRLLLGIGSVELFNPKVIRSAQGALFHLNVSEEVDLQTTLTALSNSHSIILTDPASEEYLDTYDFKKKSGCVVVFGNEAGGICAEIMDVKNYERLKIRMYSDCESLNIAVSAGIILNHAASSLKK